MSRILLATVALFLVAAGVPVRCAKPPEFDKMATSLFMDNAFECLEGERPVFATKDTTPGEPPRAKVLNRPSGEDFDRSEMMERLSSAESLIAECLSNNRAFKSNARKIEEESDAIIRIGEKLFFGDPDYCMEDGYLKQAQDMKTAAVQMKTLAQRGDYDAASRAFSRVKKSCTACHDEFRL